MCKELLILAGGKGTRLGAATSETPKPAVVIAGRPFIFWLLDWAILHSFQTVVIAVGYKANKLREIVGESYKTMRVKYSEEAQPLGTGGAIKNALHMLPPTFTCINGDSLCGVTHLDYDYTPKLVVCKQPYSKDIRYGGICTEQDNVTQFLDKAQSDLTNAGIYYLNALLFSNLPYNKEISFERDILPSWVEKNILKYQYSTAELFDMGTPEGFKITENHLKLCTHLHY